ncbi:MAG TPA: ImmA/IrrE family metallo-endopeptidase [Solirubrobacterales bacterium]
MPDYRCGECGETFFERSLLAPLSPCQHCGADGTVELDDEELLPRATAERKVDPREAPRVAAAALLSELGVDRPPIDVEAIAMRLGAPVTYAPLGNVEGEFRDGRIVVNRDFPRVRRRFTIAHEIGHLRMHADSDRAGEEVEPEAQAFAGALLIPPAMLAATFAEDDSFESLRRRFDVSRDALSIALSQARLTAS